MPDTAYARLLHLRTGLRHFERWSAQQARAAGLTPAHHQLLLAIRGHGDPEGPTVGEVADYLLLRHHSAVGLIDRAEAAGLVRRSRSEGDHRVVRLQLTKDGARRLEALSALHLEELDRLALDLPGAWAGLGPVQRPHGFPGAPLTDKGDRTDKGDKGDKGDRTDKGDKSKSAQGGVEVGIARVYEPPEAGVTSVLVDRLWPRGVAKHEAPFGEWRKDLAPSAELRKWYGHVPERFDEFAARYRAELAESPAKEALAALRVEARHKRLVLVTATKDLERAGAAVLAAVLTGR